MTNLITLFHQTNEENYSETDDMNKKLMSNKYKYESHLEYFKIQGVFDFDYNSLRLLMEI